jgi:hypothetical protein
MTQQCQRDIDTAASHETHTHPYNLSFADSAMKLTAAAAAAAAAIQNRHHNGLFCSDSGTETFGAAAATAGCALQASSQTPLLWCKVLTRQHLCCLTA